MSERITKFAVCLILIPILIPLMFVVMAFVMVVICWLPIIALTKPEVIKFTTTESEDNE